MANQSVQPVQMKSAPANHGMNHHLYHAAAYNQVHSGFATVNAVQKKDKASISSIFSWKKDKIRTNEQPPTLRTSYQPTATTTAFPIQYAPHSSNYIIDSNRKLMHYNHYNYNSAVYKPSVEAYHSLQHQQQFPSTIHATIRYLPNHKQRTNILTTNWEPNLAYPAASQPMTFQHEITYSEQITIAPSPCHLAHHPQCLTANHACCSLAAASKQNQSCKCVQYVTNDKSNYFLVPATNSSLLESSSKLLNRSTDCMLSTTSTKKGSLQSKHSSIRGSKSHRNLNVEQQQVKTSSPSSIQQQATLTKKKGTKLAATVNERFLRIFKKSIKEPFSTTKKSRKSILDCDLTAYDLVEEEEDSKENHHVEELNAVHQMTANLDTSLEEDDDQFENNFLQAKAKQKQHYYSPFSDQQTNGEKSSTVEDKNQKNKNASSSLNTSKGRNKQEEDRWTSGQCPLFTPSTSTPTAKLNAIVSTPKGKFNSCRIAGQGMQISKRMSILESDLCKDFLKEEQSEDEDQNRFSKYAHNFEQLVDKVERPNSFKLDKFNDLNNFRLFNSASQHSSSIPNLPDPDYDDDVEQDVDDDDDRHTLTMFSRSTPDLDQTATDAERYKRSSATSLSLYNLDNPFKDHRPSLSTIPSLVPPPLPPLPKSRSQQLIASQSQDANNSNSAHQKSTQSSSPTSSTYSSFNSSINSNVKSILKKSNPNLVLLKHHLKMPATESLFGDSSIRLKTLKRKDSKLSSFNSAVNVMESDRREECKLTKRCSLNKSVSTFKSSNTINAVNQKKLDDYKPKKQVHFRSSFNDELIVEHIDNQELNEEEQIYDDIMTTTRMKSTNASDSGEAEKDERFSSGSKYSNQSPEQNFDTKNNGLLSSSCTGKFDTIKERSYWGNQSSQLPKATITPTDQLNGSKLLRNTTPATTINSTGSDELQSTALVKQNQKQNAALENHHSTTNSIHLLRQASAGSIQFSDNAQTSQSPFISQATSNSSATGEKSLAEELSIQSTKMQSNAQTEQSSPTNNGFKEDSGNNLFNRNHTDTHQQMSPSSSSSTSAYVSLYASSSFSSACSSSSNYSTTAFNEHNNNNSTHSNESTKKISRSAILDSLINRKHHNKLLDKSLTINGKTESETKENKIVIDVSNNNSGNYDSLNQSIQNEHIYEELECGFEREINIIDNVNNNLNSVKKSIFNGASKDEILGYLVDAKERIQELLINSYNDQYSSQQNKFSSLSTSCHNIAATNRANRRNRVSNLSNVSSDSSSSSDILITNSMSNSIGQHLERNDSGVGTETSKPNSLDIRMSKSEACLTELIDNHITVHFDDHTEDIEDEATSCLNNKSRNLSKTTNDSGAEEQICADCDQIICAEINEQTGQIYYPLLCLKCHKRRTERKEIISEFVETEFKYGRDLRIIREEFYRPIEIAGLLTKDQLKSVFLNLEELIQVNSKFSEKLQDAIDIATEQGDEDYTTVDIGKLFMESCDMMKSFQTYCIKQASASRLLGQLEKDKEFLRIFLRVSQMENVLLRRMNLSAFLMVPVQRVTKYPLLLNRLFKVTPYHHADRGKLKEAQHKVEMHLEQINQQTKGTAPNNSKIWRRISNLSNNSASKRSNLVHLDDLENVKLKKASFNSSVRELFKAFKSRS